MIVVILNAAPKVPVYHAFDDALWDADTQRTIWRMVCGRRERYDYIWAKLDERHAAKFARPCTRCFDVT